MDLHRQNYVLESEKEKLIMELISTGISNSNSNHDDADADEVEDEDEIDEPQSGEFRILVFSFTNSFICFS